VGAGTARITLPVGVVAATGAAAGSGATSAVSSTAAVSTLRTGAGRVRGAAAVSVFDSSGSVQPRNEPQLVQNCTPATIGSPHDSQTPGGIVCAA
jgi:hypothetical protein